MKIGQYLPIAIGLTLAGPAVAVKAQTSPSQQHTEQDAGESSKEYEVSGTVLDETKAPAAYFDVSIADSKDSVVSNTISDSTGKYVFEGVPDGQYYIHISSDGYRTSKQAVSVNGGNAVVPTISMVAEDNHQQIGEIKVVGNIPVKQLGDTTQYNANSFKVNPDATSEDLVRKMPGVDLSSGTVKVQGETVNRVYVDGKAFFGDDATATLRNLPAEVVDQVQVYDEKSEQSKLTGFDDGNTTKAINIVTKPDKRGGYFGKVIAAGGTDSRYNLSGNVNYFNGDRRISLIGQSNNINAQNFSAQDLLGTSGGGGRGFGGATSGAGGRGGSFGGSGGGSMGGSGGMSSGGASFMNGGQSGIVKTNTLGINYSDKLFKKIDLSASYFFNNSNSDIQQQTNRTYVSTANAGQIYNEGDTTNAHNYNHRFNMRATYTIDSANTIVWIPTFSYQKNNSKETDLGSTLDPTGSLLNSTDNYTDSRLHGYSFNSTAIYAHKFKKANRSFSLMMNNTWNRNAGTTNFWADNRYYESGALDSLYELNQFASPVTNGWSVGGGATYSEPLSKYSAIQVMYNINYQKSKSDVETYDYDSLTSSYSDLNQLLSNKYQTYYLTNSAGLRYRFFNGKIRFIAGMSAQRATLNSDRQLPVAGTLQRNYNNIIPDAMFRYNISKTKNLGIFYRTSTSSPTVNQLQDVLNNSNPLQLSSGNPLLSQSYTHNLFARYSATDLGSGSMFFAMLRGAITQHYVTNSTIIADEDMVLTDYNDYTLKKGSQFTRPVNMNGYYSLTGFAVWGRPVSAIKSNFNVNLNAGITRTPGMINDEVNYSNNRNAGVGLTLSSNVSENIDFTVSSNTNMNFVKNSLSTSTNNNYLNEIARASLNYIIYDGIVFNTEYNFYLYKGMSASQYNQHFMLWNMSIAKKFLKNNAGEIKVSVYDLLNQNRSISPTFTETYNQYVLTNALKRYFLVTFTYTLRQFKGQSSEKDMYKNDGDMMRGGPMGPPPAGGGMMPPPGN